MEQPIIVYDIYEYINSFAPFDTQDGFDNSGLLIGDDYTEVKRAAVCLDITNAVIREAHARGAELIISHHPVIFHKPASINRLSPVYNLIQYGIDALCVHTPLDMAADGISDMMYRLMGFPDPENAPVLHVVHPDKGIGYGKIAYLDPPVTAEALAEKAKEAFGCKVVKYADCGKDMLFEVAVCSGAGNDEIYACIEQDIDAIITGDVKHHGFVDAVNAGITVIDAGHFNTEFIVCKPLMDKLQRQFPGVEFFIPETAKDVCEYL